MKRLVRVQTQLVVWLLAALSTGALGACRDQPAVGVPPLPTPPSEDPAKAVLVSAAEPIPDSGPPRAFVPERVQGTGAAMGTHIAFAAYTTPTVDGAKAKIAFDAAIEEIKRCLLYTSRCV